jgi:hypothetical protein
MEAIELEKLPGLKRGKKRKVSEEQENAIREGLIEWREDELLDKIYPGTNSISAQTVLGDEVIDKLASCGERIETQAEMRRHIQWAIGFNENTGYSTTYGEMLLAKLRSIYTKFDDETAAEDAHVAELQAMPGEIDPINFYSNSAQSDTGGNSLQGQVAVRGTGGQRAQRGGRVSHVRGAQGARTVGRSRGNSRGQRIVATPLDK